MGRVFKSPSGNDKITIFPADGIVVMLLDGDEKFVRLNFSPANAKGVAKALVEAAELAGGEPANH